MLRWETYREDHPSSTKTVTMYATEWTFGIFPKTVPKDVEIGLHGYSTIIYNAFSNELLIGTIGATAVHLDDRLLVRHVAFKPDVKILRAKNWSPPEGVELDAFDPTEYQNYVQDKFNQWCQKAGLILEKNTIDI